MPLRSPTLATCCVFGLDRPRMLEALGSGSPHVVLVAVEFVQDSVSSYEAKSWRTQRMTPYKVRKAAYKIWIARKQKTIQRVSCRDGP